MHDTPKTIYFRLNRADLLESLPKKILPFLPFGWKLKTLSLTKERQDFYDTFEWQAFSRGVVIIKTKRVLSLADLNTGHEITSVPFTRNPVSFFSDALSAGKLKEKLCSCSNIRAFIRLCSINVSIRSYQILDDNEKTLAILTAKSLSLANREKPNPFLHIVSLSPLKGYEKEMTPIETSLLDNDEACNRLDLREFFGLIMKAAGHNVQDYSSKIRLTLNPNAPVHESAQRLLQFTCSVMRQNEDGIKKNIDSEFLHDYRVAIRRTRSILKQLKGVFDTSEIAYYLNFFRDLGRRTNELRDSDVYLLRQTTYFHYLPPLLRPSLKLFFSDIALSRKTKHKQFCNYIASDDYLSFLDKWDAFINRPSLPETELAPNASLSTMNVAVETIKKALKKVIRHGRLISQETTDAELHRLRIDCKKLRYLLEFFASIFPHKTIIPVIMQLKELQENLGDFVDFAVQLRFLHEQLELMPADKLLAASTGGLMAILFQKQEEARLKFNKTFKSFDNEETSHLFNDLLTST